jgi:hypothetical protein
MPPQPTAAGRRKAPPPASVPGNLWTEIEAPEPGSFTPQATVSVIVSGPDPDGVLELTLAALSAQSYPASLLEVVAAGAGAPGRSPGRAALGAEGPELRLVDDGAERGAAEAASGELLIFLQAGQIPAPGLVEAHARWHHAVSDAVSVGRSVPVDAGSLSAEEVRDAARTGRLESLFQSRLRPDPAQEALERYLELTRGLTERRADLFRVAASPNLCLRRESYRAAGPAPDIADERLARLDRAYRLEQLGCVFVPERGAESFDHYPHTGPALKGLAEAEAPAGESAPNPLTESLIPVRGFRQRGSGRRFRRPALVVHLRAEEEPAAEVMETVDRVLRGRLQDLELRIELPPDHPERALVEEACAADPRIVVAPPADTAADSPYEVTLPAIAVPDERTLEDLHELMVEEGVGALHVTVPGELPRRAMVEVVAAGPLARARRLAEHARAADGQGPDPAVILGELFGERWVSGVEVSLRRRGAPEPQVTEHGPLARAEDLAHERAEHLRQRARAATNQARADRQAQRWFRERVRANHERLQAERLEARLARMNPPYWIRSRLRRLGRRLRSLPGAIGSAFGSLRQLAYRGRRVAGAALARARR